MLCQISQEILKASKNNHSSWRDLQLMCIQLTRICEGCSTGRFVFQVITEGGMCRIDFSRNLKGILMCKYDCNSNSYKFSSKFTFITFFSFHRNQKQESNFQQVGGLVTRNSFAFFYSESRSTSKVCRIQKIFIKRFSYMSFLLELQLFHALVVILTNVIY